MNAAILVLISVIFLSLGYRFYAAKVSAWLGVDPERPTPAHTMTDGVDYVPARAPILMGHHFASIAGAGPIVGPILAAVYGWLPAFLWILVGTIFVGAVHDFASVVASVRHEGKSIGEVIEENVGALGRRLFLAFSWSSLILVIAVFADVVAKAFVSKPEVATSSILFIALAICFGFAVYRRKAPLGIASIVGVILLALCIYAGLRFPLEFTKDAKMNYNIWVCILLVYIFLAATAPVWVLLQPRDYLNSFLLYAMLLGGMVGVFFSFNSVPLKLDAFRSANPKLGPIFPILFVTVACGAVSGFHSLVASGTTSKQLNNERDAKPIGYGAMAIEGLLAVLALASVAILTGGDYLKQKASGGPVVLFANGIGHFLEGIHIPQETGVVFASLAVSAFALTSLDTCARLGRFAWQEFFEVEEPNPTFRFLQNRFTATLITVTVGAVLLWSGGFSAVWPIFGSANQLLAALALLAVSLWLIRSKRRALFVIVPMVFMFAVTLSALGVLIHQKLHEELSVGKIALIAIAGLLFVLAIVLVWLAFTGLWKRKQEAPAQ